jgi:hypothetical protein
VEKLSCRRMPPMVTSTSRFPDARGRARATPESRAATAAGIRRKTVRRVIENNAPLLEASLHPTSARRVQEFAAPQNVLSGEYDESEKDSACGGW